MTELWNEMTPHLVANLLTVWFVYSGWLAGKSEKTGDNNHKIIGYGGMAAVLVFALFGLYR